MKINTKELQETIINKEKDLDNMYKRYYVETRDNIRDKMYTNIQNLRCEIHKLEELLNITN